MPRQGTTELADQAVTMRLLPSVLTVFLGFLSIGVPLPALPGQVHGALGFGTVMVGLVIGAQSVATLLSRQFGGVTVDTKGPRRASLIGLASASLAGVMYGLSCLPGLGSTGSLALLLAGRALLGLGESLFLTAAMVWGIGLVGPRHAGKVMTWNGMAMYGALATGAPIGVAVQAWFGFPGIAAAVVALPLLGLAITLGRRGIPPVGGVRTPFTRVLGTIWQPGAGLALATVGYATLASFVVLLYAARGWAGAGYALTAFGVAYLAVRLLFGHLPDRLGLRRVAVPSLLIEAAGQLMVWAAPTPWVALAGAAVTGAGFSLLFPTFGIEAVRRVPPASRGAALGAYAVFFDVALGVAGPLTGILAGTLGYPAAFMAGAISALAALPLVFALRRGAAG